MAVTCTSKFHSTSFVNTISCMDIKVINFNAHHTSQRISMDMFFFEAITKVHSNTLTKMWYKLIPEYPRVFISIRSCFWRRSTENVWPKINLPPTAPRSSSQRPYWNCSNRNVRNCRKEWPSLTTSVTLVGCQTA